MGNGLDLLQFGQFWPYACKKVTFLLFFCVQTGLFSVQCPCMKNIVKISNPGGPCEDVELEAGQIWMHHGPGNVIEYYILTCIDTEFETYSLVCLNDGLSWNTPVPLMDRWSCGYNSARDELFLGQEEFFTLVTNKTVNIEIQ